FLFNCLNSIKLFTIENDTEKASRFLTKFSRLIRLILQNSKSARVRLADELEALRLYIEMESMRFENKFSFTIETNGVDAEGLEVPPLILQPYVENAIWHGLMHKDGPGHLMIAIHLEDDQLVCTIEDDGVGIDVSQAIQAGQPQRKKSYGMAITGDRLSLIRKLYDVNARVRVEKLEQNGSASGTRVTIHVPAMYIP
ncbi:MAG: histidine kinase, partial [Saprospiraceae bacterium]|nr:histidine kinase [Saprospiraceae bacterium]